MFHLNAGVNQERARHQNKTKQEMQNTSEAKRIPGMIAMMIIWTKEVHLAYKTISEIRIDNKGLQAGCL